MIRKSVIWKLTLVSVLIISLAALILRKKPAVYEKVDISDYSTPKEHTHTHRRINSPGIGEIPESNMVITLQGIPTNPSGTIRGYPKREYEAISAKYFLDSPAKDTWVGQKIVSELIRSGAGLEYASFVYMDALMIGHMKNSVSGDVYTNKVNQVVSRFIEGRYGLPGLKEKYAPLLNELLTLAPAIGYFKKDCKPIMKMDGEEKDWSSSKDVLAYIVGQPATQ